MPRKMQNAIALLLVLTLLAPTHLAAQTGEGAMLVNSKYLNYYGFAGGSLSTNTSLVRTLPRATQKEFGKLDGEANIDTPEEFITAAYFSPVQIQVTDISAVERELPHNDPIAAGKKLGAMWYKKLLEATFADPGNTQQLANYELAIKTICERTGVTRAQIIETYKAGIADVVAEAVDREFNTVGFMIDSGKTYGAVLTRIFNTDTNKYTYKLAYEGYFNGTKETRTLPAEGNAPLTLDALLAAMSANTADFNDACVKTVRRNADLIPAVVYTDWTRPGLGLTNGVALVKEALTNFYLNPTQTNFNVLIGIYARRSTVAVSHPGDEFTLPSISALSRSIHSLSSTLGTRYSREATSIRNIFVAARTPNDPRFDVFFKEYQP